MTDKEIIQALECCESHTCFGCPFYADMGYKCKGVNAQLIDLINRQQAEIEEKKELLKACEIGIKDVKNLVIQNRKTTLQIYNAYEQKIKISRAEAIKEFAEKLKKYHYKASSNWSGITTTSKVVDVYVIDNLVKEMVGADNEKF